MKEQEAMDKQEPQVDAANTEVVKEQEGVAKEETNAKPKMTHAEAQAKFEELKAQVRAQKAMQKPNVLLSTINLLHKASFFTNMVAIFFLGTRVWELNNLVACLLALTSFVPGVGMVLGYIGFSQALGWPWYYAMLVAVVPQMAALTYLMMLRRKKS